MQHYQRRGTALANFSFKDAAGTAGAAAGTAVAPGLGTVVGTAVGNILGDLFGGNKSSWDSAGPGVHDWFTNVGEQEFLDWMRANRPNDFDDLNKVKAIRMLVWDHDKYGGRYNGLTNPDVTWPGMDASFAAVGVDLRASQARALARTGQVNTLLKEDVVMLPGAGSPAVPQVVVEAVKDANAAATNGTATTDQRNLIDKLIQGAKDIGQAAAEGIKQGGGVTVKPDLGDVLKQAVPWILGALLVLLIVNALMRRAQ